METQINKQLTALRSEQARLAREWEEFQAERVRLDGEWDHLLEREQRVQGLYRFSLVALIVSSLVSVPSTVFLVVLMRQGQQKTSDKAGMQAQTRQRDQWEQITRRRATPIHGGNGRGKEPVGYSL